MSRDAFGVACMLSSCRLAVHIAFVYPALRTRRFGSGVYARLLFLPNPERTKLRKQKQTSDFPFEVDHVLNWNDRFFVSPCDGRASHLASAHAETNYVLFQEDALPYFGLKERNLPFL